MTLTLKRHNGLWIARLRGLRRDGYVWDLEYTNCDLGAVIAAVARSLTPEETP